MAASPAANPDESFVGFSSRESTPPPVVKSADFVPIELPPTDGFSLSAPTAMSDSVAGVSASAAGRSEVTLNNTDHVTVTSTVGSHAPMVGANIGSPQITWSAGSDGMSFSFNGLTTTTSTTTLSTTAVTSPSESSSYVSTSGFSSGADDCDEHKTKPKPKRRRIITKDQRRAANQRERRRMVTLNDAFDMLKQRIPTFSHEKKLSRIETLRLAISYISFMAQLVDGKHPSDVTIDLPYAKQDDQSMQAGLHDVIENYNYVMQTALGAEQPMPSMDNPTYVMDMNQHAHGYYPNGTFLTQ